MKRKKISLKSALVIATTLILLAISLFPYYYMLIQSFVPWDKVDQTIFSGKFSLVSYKYLLNSGEGANPYMWIRALANSLIVSLPTAVISVAVGLLVGYSVSKLKFNGKGFIYNTLLIQMFFPVIILLVPRYLIAKSFANSYTGMILPLCISIWGIFMYVNFFVTIPNDVFEAAKIDGANELQLIYKIALPLSKTVTVIVFLSTFMARWSELMWDMLISPNINMQTLNVIISTQFNSMGNLPGPMYAASVLLTTPIVIMFLCFSKYFKEGISFMLK